MTSKPIQRDANMEAPTLVQSVRSLALPAAGRGEDLQLRISAPVLVDCVIEMALAEFAALDRRTSI
ncbi:hypothetical protein FHX59_001008 [Paraburkholderia silvatlantica]|uniref:Uncharacterized protein n=1 Tax=Paraburkholderia silvatlantica TaxID=321895 RepID=A0ABR6FGQ0_9BURK|nr:hypothetical protein [Paraburkholderia silvatlantica]PVY37763.1 hypothetical protein C7411_101380 [Paraburkholderia silvatlantica]PXW42727.1 hypothetical protein C7413_101382 [Paraburkholderia silvatlantica]